ncbi:hypothetical protein [Pontibacter mangrovi]|uniref:Uncharacterized protein n=1 Tax=Pontibacter mangrovi TaxID=2589816 RepID=A0A501W2W3_9BACT|nr:hypothetical protein [Pontibacter mangrovi]TPE42424.1 hypothetical protein FJM65_18555 [Pontibacter mangrovi]
MNKRQQFLSSFLGALGAEEIKWTEITDKIVAGTAIYDKTDPEELQDFKWQMTESKSPDDKTQILIDHIFEENLLDIDRLKKPISEIQVPGLTDQEKDSAFDKLFKVRVKMIDEGEETDFYFIHQ